MTREDLQTIADLTAEYLGLSVRPRLRQITTAQGHAHPRRGHFSVPRWAFVYGEAHVTWYVVHEVCHFHPVARRLYRNQPHHGPAFKRVETLALAQWGLVPVYGRAYPNALRSLDGQILWTRKRGAL